MPYELRITVCEGRNLVARDSNALSDPYVKVNLRDMVFRTKVARQSLNPRWKTAGIFPYNPLSTANLVHFLVRDFDGAGQRSQKMGKIVLKCDGMTPASGRVEEWFPVAHGKGELLLRVEVCETKDEVKEEHDASSSSDDEPEVNLTRDERALWIEVQKMTSNQSKREVIMAVATEFPHAPLADVRKCLEHALWNVDEAQAHLLEREMASMSQSKAAKGLFNSCVLGVFDVSTVGIPDDPTKSKAVNLQDLRDQIMKSGIPAKNLAAVGGPVRPTGRRKALCVGIDYTSEAAWGEPLKGCVADAERFKRLLVSGFGFNDDVKHLVLMTDKPGSRNWPTKQNMIRAMRWLVQGAEPGDCLFFSFSGHGVRTRDKSGDERDGKDEAICPLDGKQKGVGVIVDDHLHSLLVAPLPAGVKLTVILDCCHSGGGLDLSYTWNAEEGQWKKSKSAKRAAADVQLISGCSATEKSADVLVRFYKGPATPITTTGGALSLSLVSALASVPHGTHTYTSLLAQLTKAIHRKGYKQNPTLSSSQPFGMHRKFHLTKDILTNQNKYVPSSKQPPRPLGLGQPSRPLGLGQPSQPLGLGQPSRPLGLGLPQGNRRRY